MDINTFLYRIPVESRLTPDQAAELLSYCNVGEEITDSFFDSAKSMANKGYYFEDIKSLLNYAVANSFSVKDNKFIDYSKAAERIRNILIVAKKELKD